MGKLDDPHPRTLDERSYRRSPYGKGGTTIYTDVSLGAAACPGCLEWNRWRRSTGVETGSNSLPPPGSAQSMRPPLGRSETTL